MLLSSIVKCLPNISEFQSELEIFLRKNVCSLGYKREKHIIFVSTLKTVQLRREIIAYILHRGYAFFSLKETFSNQPNHFSNLLNQ